MITFATALERAGFFNGLRAEDSKGFKDNLEENGWNGIFEDSHRFFHADAENLAESGIGDFIRSVEPFLNAQGVPAVEARDELTDDGSYIAHVNDVPHLIYDEAEFDRDVQGKEPGLIWALSMTRGFRIVDELLEKAGSAERLYAVNGGNDLFAFFLTPEMQQIIFEHPDADLRSAPYKPTEEYPWFGQPH